MYEYNCKIVRVIDGDSIILDIDLGFSHWIHGESIRLYGVDCPECRSRDKEEKAAGLLAKDFVKSCLHVGETYKLTTKEKGKFGRYLGTIYLTEENSINAALVKERLAVPYFGQSKVRVQEAHLANRITNQKPFCQKPKAGINATA
jgi:micrococcal nuclease